MYKIEGLSSEDPNVSFRVGIGNIDYFFLLHIFRGVLYCSIWIDDYMIVSGMKCINNAWLIPYKHLASGGNFRFEGSFDDYVSPKTFGKITTLNYYSREEYMKLLSKGK